MIAEPPTVSAATTVSTAPSADTAPSLSVVPSARPALAVRGASALRPVGPGRSQAAWRTIENRLAPVADDASLLIGLRAHLDQIRRDRP